MARFNGKFLVMTKRESECMAQFHPGRFVHGYIWLRHNNSPDFKYMVCQHIRQYDDKSYDTYRIPAVVIPAVVLP